MARCGCSSECVCSIGPSDCIAVSGNGSTGAPYVLAPIIDPDATNALACGPDGLFAVPLAYEQTTCIDLAGAGTLADPLLVTPVIDPDLDNILECGIAGLLATVTVGDTDCIALSGSGSAGNPILATPVIPVSTGNILTCGADGLVAGGQPLYNFVQALSVAGNIAAVNAAAVTYLATL